MKLSIQANRIRPSVVYVVLTLKGQLGIAIDMLPLWELQYVCIVLFFLCLNPAQTHATLIWNADDMKHLGIRFHQCYST